MPRIIFKCPYIKPGTGGAAAHRSRYVRYVATREGVEKLTPDKADLPATKKQQTMVERIVRDFPMSRGMFEYEDYKATPTRAAASEFITRAIEDNCDQIAKRENYVSYIAQRPRAERVGIHGLFTSSDDPLVLSRIAEEVAHHPGNVWLPIISLRREDAARLGYDSAERWRTLLRSYATEMAEAMKIPWEQFRWYAAFHDEGHHPHVHVICYSADGQSGFLTKEGIAHIKSGLAQEIFRQNLVSVYQKQTQRRDKLVRESGEVMKELIRQMHSGTLENPRIEQLTGELAQRLKRTTGKKQYGYLKAPLKSLVDEIVDELAKDSRVAAAYDLWYQLREEVLRTYKNDLPQRLLLSQQKEFKRIKNLVIQEAVQLGEYTEAFAPTDTQEPDQAEEDTAPAPENRPQNTDTQAETDEPPHADRRSPKAKYQAAKRILTDTSSKPEQIGQAVDWLTQAAEAGLDYAQYALGKLYLLGKDVPQDRDTAVHWLTLAAEQSNQHARYFLDHMNDASSLFSSATQLLHHMGRIFQEQAPPPSGGISFVDSKLRQRIREKKIAMGHKPDDHEEPTQQLR